jgi:preprotein translocase subunit YajC
LFNGFRELSELIGVRHGWIFPLGLGLKCQLGNGFAITRVQMYSPADFQRGASAKSPNSVQSRSHPIAALALSPKNNKQAGARLMFVTPAFAQAATGAPVGSGGIADILVQLMPILLLVVIFWFLIFRPQQKRLKAQQAMLSAIRRGDTVVTTGGIVGKVTKAVDGEDLEVEIAPTVKIKVVRGMIADVRTKADPVNDNKPA